MRLYLRINLLFFFWMTLLLGFIYPGISTLAAQNLFPREAQGSLIEKNGRILGSELIGQNFSDPKYFWGRLSATSPQAYNAANSSGSNFSPANPALLDAVKGRLGDLKKADPTKTSPVPVDLVTASGSGLDPHISVAASEYQVHRVAMARGLTEAAVRDKLKKYTRGPQFGILGEPTVNVLMLNLDLDGKL